MSIAIVGCTTVDLIFPAVPRLPKWPRHTEFTPENLLLLPTPPIFSIGGNGANAAYVAACSRQEVSLYSNIGDDTLGSLARKWLESAGSRVHSLDRGHTAVNVTAANHRHQRATFFYPGPPVPLPVKARLAEDDYLLVCGWPHPPSEQLIRTLPALRKSGSFVAFDAGPLLGPSWKKRELEEILEGLSLFMANEHEVTTLMGADSLRGALQVLRRTFAGQILIKRGRHGAVWSEGPESRLVTVKAPRVRAISTIGAGDSFNGALMAALDLGRAMPEAIASACEIAARVVASAKGVSGTGRYRFGA